MKTGHRFDCRANRSSNDVQTVSRGCDASSHRIVRSPSVGDVNHKPNPLRTRPLCHHIVCLLPPIVQILGRNPLTSLVLLLSPLCCCCRCCCLQAAVGGLDGQGKVSLPAIMERISLYDPQNETSAQLDPRRSFQQLPEMYATVWPLLSSSSLSKVWFVSFPCPSLCVFAVWARSKTLIPHDQKGRLLCAVCTPHFESVPELQLPTPVRICVDCNVLSDAT